MVLTDVCFLIKLGQLSFYNALLYLQAMAASYYVGWVKESDNHNNE